MTAPRLTPECYGSDSIAAGKAALAERAPVIDLAAIRRAEGAPLETVQGRADERDRRARHGWWILPSLILGALMWAAAIYMIAATAFGGVPGAYVGPPDAYCLGGC